MKSSRLAVSAVFVCHGLMTGSWAARVSDVQTGLGLSDSALGVALLGFAVGGVTVLPIAGGMSARLGGRVVTVAGWLPLAVGLTLVGHASSQATLAAALALFGVGLSVVDVGMNAAGAAVERAMGRSVMIGFHAGWSIGGGLGAALGSGAIELGWSPALHIGVAAVVTSSAVAVASTRFPVHLAARTRPPLLAFPSRVLLGLAAVGTVTALGEGAAVDWASVHLRDVLDSSAPTAAWGYLLFALGMTVARLRGDRAAERTAVATLVRRRAFVAASGFALVAIAPSVPVALTGFALAGAGLAVLIPLAFAVAERVPGVAPGQGVAGVATVSYAAFIAGPPLIGLVADASSLRVSMGLVAVALAVVAVRPPDPALT